MPIVKSFDFVGGRSILAFALYNTGERNV